jgi:acyl-coenzyme A thioesterase PaaI-like protein
MQALNEQFLPGNTCFGCGLDNPEGMRIRIYRDGDSDTALAGTFDPRATMGGFPQIVHGGLQFTALDCMAGWCALMLRGKHRPLMPLTKNASMRFLRPARLGAQLSLRARIVGEAAAPKDPIRIQTSIVDAEGNALSEADFDYVLLPEDRFKKAVGIDALPDSYARHFKDL